MIFELVSTTQTCPNGKTRDGDAHDVRDDHVQLISRTTYVLRGKRCFEKDKFETRLRLGQALLDSQQ
jgi:hypothetical protein